MAHKKDFSPTVNKLKDVPMDHIENTSQFETFYIRDSNIPKSPNI